MNAHKYEQIDVSDLNTVERIRAFAGALEDRMPDSDDMDFLLVAAGRTKQPNVPDIVRCSSVTPKNIDKIVSAMFAAYNEHWARNPDACGRETEVEACQTAFFGLVVEAALNNIREQVDLEDPRNAKRKAGVMAIASALNVLGEIEGVPTYA